MLAALNLSAQTARESIGVGAPGLARMPSAAETAKEQQDFAAMMAEENQYMKIQIAGSQPYRVVDAKIYNVLTSQLWHHIQGQVNSKTRDGVLILYSIDDSPKPIGALKNYSGNGVSGQNISAVAINVGTYSWGETPLELWDCGTSPSPEQWEQIKDEEAKALALIEQQKAAAQKIAQAKAYALQANTIRWLLSQATNGDASAQCDLGEHYLNGLGCETNLEQAIFWLQKSAAQGNLGASNKLASLQKLKTP